MATKRCEFRVNGWMDGWSGVEDDDIPLTYKRDK